MTSAESLIKSTYNMLRAPEDIQGPSWASDYFQSQILHASGFVGFLKRIAYLAPPLCEAFQKRCKGVRAQCLGVRV